MNFVESLKAVLAVINGELVALGASAYSLNAGSWTAPVFDPCRYVVRRVVHRSQSDESTYMGFSPFAKHGDSFATSVDPGSKGLQSVPRLQFISSGDGKAAYSDLTTQVSVGGKYAKGFFLTMFFGAGILDVSGGAGLSQFFGLRNSAYEVGDTQEPNNSYDLVGFSSSPDQDYLQFICQGGVLQASIDLGEDFPVTPGTNDAYFMSLYAPADPVAAGFKLGWYIKRLGHDIQASGVVNDGVGDVIPASNLVVSAYRYTNIFEGQISMEVGPITLITGQSL